MTEPEQTTLSEALIGQVVSDRYRVEALLGEGGMGAVYRAEHIMMRKLVALKVLHREMTAVEEARARFEREAIAAGRIEHPNVVNATDFGKLPDGSAFLVLDYVSGRSLADVLQGERWLPEGRAVHITKQIVSALIAAHGAGVIHRDLKPDNVMLVEQGGDPDFVKVLDFGIAKLQSQSGTGKTLAQLTQAGSVFGTPDYMSPEQAAGTPIDHRADLYTVGIMLYEMLGGRTPFHDESILVMLTRHMTEAHKPLPNTVSAPLRQIVDRLLQKAPSDRFASAEELLAALDGNAPASGLQPLGKAAASLPSEDVSQPSSVAVAQTIADGAELSAPMAATQLEAPQSHPMSQLKAELSHLSRGLKAARSRALDSAPSLTAMHPLRLLASRPIQLGKRALPLWTLAAGAFAVGLVLVLSTAMLLTDQQPDEAATATPSTSKLTDVLDAVNLGQGKTLKAAASGDAKALSELEQLPETDRSAEVWLNLGHGYFARGQPKRGLHAYDKAIGADKSFTTNETVLDNVLRAAWSAKLSKRALNFAAQKLGASGADLLYYVWIAKPPAHDKDLDIKAKQLLLKEARNNASDALGVLLELRDAKRCTETKALLPRVTQHADSRALRQLEKRRNNKGCGFLGLQDCYACLRGDAELNDAIEAVKKRPAPKFERPSSARESSADETLQKGSSTKD